MKRILTDETLQIRAERKQREREETLWTDVKDVYTGNGGTPAVVVIPLAERDAPHLSIYCIDSLVDPKEVYQVQNNASAGLTFDNSVAAISVRIGKPPKSKYYQFTPDQPSSQAHSTGGSGATAFQVAQKQQQFITVDRIYELKLEAPATGLILNLTKGYFRIDNTWSVWEGGAFWDATDSIPSTASTARYVLLCIDINNAPQLTLGDTFTTGTGSVYANAPRNIPNGSMQLGTVYLYNNMTLFVQDNIVNLQSIPTGINESAIIDDVDYALTDDAGETLTDDLGDSLLGTS